MGVCGGGGREGGMRASLPLQALNRMDFIHGAMLSFTYFVQPTRVSSITPAGGRMLGGTRVTIDGSGFTPYPAASTLRTLRPPCTECR